MITRAEFLEIIEKHLKVRNDGSIFIEDEKLLKKFSEYLAQFANKKEDFEIYKEGQPKPDELFDGWNIYCPDKGKKN